MHRRMIKVGISCGSIVPKRILQTFSETRIFELCIPIVYAYSTVSSYNCKVNGFSSIRTTYIRSANESVKDSLNIINVSNKIIPTELEKGTTENSMAAEESLHKGISDLKAGKIDVFVVSQTSNKLLQQIVSELSDEKKSLPILINDHFRITEIFGSVSVDILTEKIKVLHSSLLHDFMLTFPRIAILSVNSPTEIITEAIQIVFQRGIFCFGIFDANFFFNSDIYKKFDASLVVNLTPTNFIFQFIQPVNRETNVIFISNSPYVVTIANTGTLLSSAIYLAIDAYRNRGINSSRNTE